MIHFYIKEGHSCGFPGGSVLKSLPAKQEIQVPFLGQEGPLAKEMATHFSILAWRIPWTEEPGGLYSPWVSTKKAIVICLRAFFNLRDYM